MILRGAKAADLPEMYQLARHLDSYNLPADRKRMKSLIALSEDSFAGRIENAKDGKYLFVLEDEGKKKIAGCSLIVAKHGTPGLPHIFMSEFVELRTSASLRKTVEHKCLKLGFTEDGPTEVGGLVLLPEYRGHPESLGLWLSFVRFVYIAAHADKFEKFILAEFLPSFVEKGRSPFWDYFGRKFTGMSYRQADRLSIDNKEFVLSLFPRGTIYQDFFPKEIRGMLGAVGGESRPAWRLLESIGFQYIHQIEPFDGGPYFAALTQSISLVQKVRRLTAWRTNDVSGGKHLVLAEHNGAARALVAPAREEPGLLALSNDIFHKLGLEESAYVWAVPLERPKKSPKKKAS